MEAQIGRKRYRCSADATHERLDLALNRCLECNKRVQEFCGECSHYLSFGNMARHMKRHRDTRFPVPEIAVVARRLKVAYVAAQWDLDTKDGKLLMGQFLGAIPDNVPFKPRHHHVNDKTGSYDVVDAYDALWCHVFDKGSFEVVRVYKTLDTAIDALESRKLPDGLDLLIMGDWTHPRKDVEMEEITKLYNLLMYCGVRVFPPLDYAWFFAHKIQYYQLLSQTPLLKGIHTIPTMIVPRDWAWKQPIQEWAAKLGSTHVVLKRNLSDQGHHVSKRSVDALGCLPERKEFDWMVQPALKEFEKHPEYRMYVINGKCRWGLATRFIKPGELTKEAIAPGRETWLAGGQDAATVAEEVTALVSGRLQMHARRFLRVDLVRRDEGGFYINELEFLGNAFIHFESFDNSQELMKDLVEMILSWI